MKDRQHRLKADLDRYFRRHSAVMQCFKDQTRLAFDAAAPYGPAHRDLFTVPRPTSSEFKRAISELDALTSSDDWLDEIKYSIDNQSRRKKQP